MIPILHVKGLHDKFFHSVPVIYLKTQEEDFKKWNLDVNHPIGSWYCSDDPTEPSIIFGGGTWEKLEGRFLISAGAPDRNTDGQFGDMSGSKWSTAVGSKGGQDFHATTLEETAPHDHGTFKNGGYCFNTSPTASAAAYGDWVKNGSLTSNIRTGKSGGGKAHNNMPPYYATYMWRRTA